MLDAVGGELRLVGLLEQPAGRRRRQHHGQRRARQAHLAGVVVAGGDQQRAALLHVAGDVLVVEQLQDVAVLVAVEDDEVEVLDPLREQLARREGDQRELMDRRAVLLLRRAQDREVHEVDGGVGLEQVAPHALAGVRLARHQQHAQVLAHALGRHDHAVVGGGQLARRRLELDLDDVLAGVRERHLDRHGAADLGGARLVRAALAADLEA